MTDQIQSEPVARLRAAIEAKEKGAQDAIDWARGGDWSEAERRQVGWGESQDDLTVLSGGKPIAVFNAEYGGAMAALHAIGNDPASVLRLCQAHRDILDQYRKAERYESLAREYWGLRFAVEALARGYGMEVT